MPETFPNYNPSGVPDGRSTGVQSIVGPGVTELGGDIYLANSDGTWGDQITGGGGGGAITLQTFSGSPVGTVVPTNAGTIGLDIVSNRLYFATGSLDTNWVQISGGSDDAAIGIQATLNDGVVIQGFVNGVEIVQNGAGGINIEAIGSATGGAVSILNEDTGGIAITDSGGGGIVLTEGGGEGGIGLLDLGTTSGSGISIQEQATDGTIAISVTDTTGAIGITAAGGGSITIGITGDKVGFYEVTPVVQAAAPTTLGDVITILTNLGLCAS